MRKFLPVEDAMRLQGSDQIWGKGSQAPISFLKIRVLSQVLGFLAGSLSSPKRNPQDAEDSKSPR